MADVKNGGGYGRFYDITETKDSATTAGAKTNTAVSSTSVVSGNANSTSELEKLKKSIISGATATGKHITNQVPGIETPQTNAAASVKNLNLKDIDSFQSKVSAEGLKPPLPNVLSYYTSYNYIFTLSVLSPEAINFPDFTYKKGVYGPLILRSGAGAPDKELVPTAYGKYDFYIDDLKMSGIIGLDKSSGNTNSTSVEFRIIEPYSMGLFFQAIQAAAFAAGYSNYLDIPLLLTIEFKGHVFDNETQLTNLQIDNTTKHIPLKLRTMDMKVTGKGTTYSINAYPWNEGGFSSQFNEAKSNITIKCNDGGQTTVQAMLQTAEQSLQKVLNDYHKGKVKSDETADQVLILFPSDLASSAGTNKTNGANERSDKSAAVNVNNSTSTSDLFKKLGVTVGIGKNTTLVQAEGDTSVNKIGQANMGFNILRKGDTPFPKEAAIYDPAKGIWLRGNIVIDPKNSDFKFSQGTSVVDMINQVILMSDYGRNALSNAQQSPEGQIPWWRVETQLYALSNVPSKTTGIVPKLVVYRVVPYLVDSSLILPVNAKRPKLNKLKSQSLKEYNYIYTGKNTEILDFNIQFNNGFYTALNADSGKNTESQVTTPASGGAVNERPGEADKRAFIANHVKGYGATNQETPTSTRTESTGSTTYKLGGGGPDDATTIAARQFQDMITEGSDMITLELTILGDPYYLGDSGMGNYSAKGVVGFQNINADGAIDYQNGTVVITVNFRTPIDINQNTGFYNFGDTSPVSQFSGLYQINMVESDFSRGKFKQVIKMFRIKGQDNPTAEEPADSSVLNTQDAKVFNTAQTNTSIIRTLTGNNNINAVAPDTAQPGVA
jgi:hypothetical protein